jgi:hypothetical protein
MHETDETADVLLLASVICGAPSNKTKKQTVDGRNGPSTVCVHKVDETANIATCRQFVKHLQNKTKKRRCPDGPLTACAHETDQTADASSSHVGDLWGT